MEVLDVGLQGAGIGGGSSVWWEANVGLGLGAGGADDRGVRRDRDGGSKVTGNADLFVGVGHGIDPGKLL